MQEIIDRLNRKILIETSQNMTSEQEYYVAGLCDALQIVEEVISDSLQVGKKYYVIMFRDNKNQSQAYIEQMKLYRINNKQKKTYCFTKQLTSTTIGEPDLMLYNKGSIKMRVHNTYEEAQKSILYGR